MKYTPKNNQETMLGVLAERYAEDFGNQYPSKTIGNHHYIRRRHLQQFLYDFAKELLDANERIS